MRDIGAETVIWQPGHNDDHMAPGAPSPGRGHIAYRARRAQEGNDEILT